MEWFVSATLTADGTLSFQQAPVDGTPVDMLIAAAAACFAKSCQLVQNARSETPTTVVADVTGIKAADAPNRLGRMRIAWSIPDLEPRQAARIARDAKRVCTVTNSLTCDIEMVER